MLVCATVVASGGEFSRDSVLASLPLVCSKKMPYPPRMAHLPLPHGSQANPIRGAGLKKCPFMQPSGTPGVTPHCTIPFGRLETEGFCPLTDRKLTVSAWFTLV